MEYQPEQGNRGDTYKDLDLCIVAIFTGKGRETI